MKKKSSNVKRTPAVAVQRVVRPHAANTSSKMRPNVQGERQPESATKTATVVSESPETVDSQDNRLFARPFLLGSISVTPENNLAICYNGGLVEIPQEMVKTFLPYITYWVEGRLSELPKEPVRLINLQPKSQN